MSSRLRNSFDYMAMFRALSDLEIVVQDLNQTWIFCEPYLIEN